MQAFEKPGKTGLFAVVEAWANAQATEDGIGIRSDGGKIAAADHGGIVAVGAVAVDFGGVDAPFVFEVAEGDIFAGADGEDVDEIARADEDFGGNSGSAQLALDGASVRAVLGIAGVGDFEWVLVGFGLELEAVHGFEGGDDLVTVPALFRLSLPDFVDDIAFPAVVDFSTETGDQDGGFGHVEFFDDFVGFVVGQAGAEDEAELAIGEQPAPALDEFVGFIFERGGQIHGDPVIDVGKLFAGSFWACSGAFGEDFFQFVEVVLDVGIPAVVFAHEGVTIFREGLVVVRVTEDFLDGVANFFGVARVDKRAIFAVGEDVAGSAIVGGDEWETGRGGFEQGEAKGFGVGGVDEDSLVLGGPAVEFGNFVGFVGFGDGADAVEVEVIDEGKQVFPDFAGAGVELGEGVAIASDDDEVGVFAQPRVFAKGADEAGEVFAFVGAGDGKDRRAGGVAEEALEFLIDGVVGVGVALAIEA